MSYADGKETDARRSCAIDRMVGEGEGVGIAVATETRVALLRAGRGTREALIIASAVIVETGLSPTVLDLVRLTGVGVTGVLADSAC